MLSLQSGCTFATLSFDGVEGAVGAFAAAFLFIGMISHFRGGKGDTSKD